jgi:hypothetical protein
MSREEDRKPVREQRRGDDDRKPARHPRFADKEDAEQRGEDPPDSVGPPRPDVDDAEDPAWEPDPNAADPWKGYIAEVAGEHRPNREDVLPYLLIRAFAPGDRAARPIWPPQPSWLSPDIHLIDDTWTGPFQADQVVGGPTAGRSYRVFVHAWNLGLLPAVGVHLRAWHVAPGFFGGQPGAYTPELIGGAFFDLAPRTAPGAHRLVEVMPAWFIPPHLTGHECLLASVECPADRWNGALDANADRHVGQRNLTILGPAADMAPLLVLLGSVLGQGELLEVTLRTDEVKGALDYGLPIAGGQHLFVAGNLDGRLFILPSTRLARLLGGELPDLSEPGTAAGLFRELWGRFEGQLWTDGLDQALGRLLDTDKLIVERVVHAFGGDSTYWLQLAAFNAEREAIGGYSIGLESHRRDPHP